MSRTMSVCGCTYRYMMLSFRLKQNFRVFFHVETFFNRRLLQPQEKWEIFCFVGKRRENLK